MLLQVKTVKCPSKHSLGFVNKYIYTTMIILKVSDQGYIC